MASIYVLVIAGLVAAVHGATLRNGVIIPTYANVCRRSQPDINDCLKDSIQTLIQKVSRDGIRQLQIEPLDPWVIDETGFSYGNGQPFKFGARLFDVSTYGFSKIRVLAVRSDFSDPEKMSLEVDFFNKKIYIEGNYAVDGIISEVPVNGRGKYNISLGDVQGTFKLKGHLVQKDNIDFLQIDRATMFPDVGDLRFQATNDNDKYAQLTNLMMVLMNTFWKNLYTEMRPMAEETFDSVMRPTFNKATLKIPFDQLIPK